MKTSYLFSTLAICLAIFITSTVQAQVADNDYRPAATKQSLHVDLTITPSTKEFKVGIAAIENTNNKIKLWVCNAAQKKCTIAISTEQGQVWTMDFKDAYYSRILDLSSLDDGDYEVSIHAGNERFEKKFTLATDTYVQRAVRLQ